MTGAAQRGRYQGCVLRCLLECTLVRALAAHHTVKDFIAAFSLVIRTLVAQHIKLYARISSTEEETNCGHEH